MTNSKYQTCEGCSHGKVCSKRGQYESFRRALHDLSIPWSGGDTLSLSMVPGFSAQIFCEDYFKNQPVARGGLENG